MNHEDSKDPRKYLLGSLQIMHDAIYEISCVGCCLHIVLDDGNVDRRSFEFCEKHAAERNHYLCVAMSRALQQLTDEDVVKLQQMYDDHWVRYEDL